MNFSDLAIEVPLTLIEERVTRGAALLDARVPGWRHQVDLGNIEPTCQHHNIASQVTGMELYEAMRHLGVITDDMVAQMSMEASEAAVDATEAHGFCIQRYVMGPASPVLRELAQQLLGQTLPDRVPIHRDESTLVMEESTLAECWRREVAKRG